jgi:hypothetical protein
MITLVSALVLGICRVGIVQACAWTQRDHVTMWQYVSVTKRGNPSVRLGPKVGTWRASYNNWEVQQAKAGTLHASNDG